MQAKLSDRRAILNILRCYKDRYPHSKLYLADSPKSVYWGHLSMLDADLQCAKQALEERHTDFDVFVNVAGTELPLFTYDRFEQVMRETGVKNIVVSYLMPENYEYRIKYSYFLKKYPTNRTMVTRPPNYAKSSPPYNLKICKGIKNVVLNRSTVEFLLYDQISMDLYNWLQDVEAPEENFYSTLIRVDAGVDSRGLLAVTQDLNTDFMRGVCPRETLWVGGKRCSLLVLLVAVAFAFITLLL